MVIAHAYYGVSYTIMLDSFHADLGSGKAPRHVPSDAPLSGRPGPAAATARPALGAGTRAPAVHRGRPGRHHRGGADRAALRHHASRARVRAAGAHRAVGPRGGRPTWAAPPGRARRARTAALSR